MELKTYRGRSMSEALARVKADLGRDAVILNTRTVRQGGVLGVGARHQVEITAAPEDPALRGGVRLNTTDAARPPDSTERLPRSAASEARVAGTMTASGNTPSVDDLLATYRRSTLATVPSGELPSLPPLADRWALKDYLRDGESGGAAAQPEAAGRVPDAPAQTTSPAPEWRVRQEIETVRQMVDELLKENRRARMPTVPDELLAYYTELLSRDVAQEVASKIVERVRGRVEEDKKEGAFKRLTGAAAAARERRIRQELIMAVGEMIPAAAPLQVEKSGAPTVVALVGPTGVGKTTTIAKLAANMKLRSGKRVGLITIDTYRIGAVEQLKSYAQILDVPLLSVQTQDAMRKAIGRLADRDLILIDTAGRSQRDDAKLEELRPYLEAARPDQVHLVLSTTSREVTIRESVRKFGAIGADRLIFTKTDEAVGLGLLLNVLSSVEMRLSYLTTGQSVPDDIEVGTAARVASLILRNSEDA